MQVSYESSACLAVRYPHAKRCLLASTGDLKKDGDIILVPQPSDSPNDPLNVSILDLQQLLSLKRSRTNEEM